MNLTLNVREVQFIYDDLDTNALNFILDDNSYFSIQTCVYEEKDERLNQPHIEFKEQGNAQRGGMERVDFAGKTIMLTFRDTKPFIKRYKAVELSLNQNVNRKIVDFFANYLFLGEMMHYETGFDESSKVSQTEYREPPYRKA